VLGSFPPSTHLINVRGKLFKWLPLQSSWRSRGNTVGASCISRGEVRFIAGHQQRRLRRDGHHAMLPSIFDPTKDLHKPCSAPETIYELTSFET
jgi:hypothetical protein